MLHGFQHLRIRGRNEQRGHVSAARDKNRAARLVDPGVPQLPQIVEFLRCCCVVILSIGTNDHGSGGAATKEAAIPAMLHVRHLMRRHARLHGRNPANPVEGQTRNMQDIVWRVKLLSITV